MDNYVFTVSELIVPLSPSRSSLQISKAPEDRMPMRLNLYLMEKKSFTSSRLNKVSKISCHRLVFFTSFD